MPHPRRKQKGAGAVETEVEGAGKPKRWGGWRWWGGAQAGSGLHTTRLGEAALGVALDLNLDANPDQVESLAQGVKHGLTDAE